MITAYFRKFWSAKRIALFILAFSLIGQTIGVVAFLKITHYSLLDQGDTLEYVTITDNLLAGRGYSAEMEDPYRLTASRTPGMLLTNLPLRFFFASDDAAAAAVGKLILLACAFFTFRIARFFLNSDWSYAAAAVITLIPTTAYYGANPYSTGPAYLLGFTAIYAGMVFVMRGRLFTGGLWVGLASLYSMSLRPAAAFPFLILVLGSLLLSFLKGGRLLRQQLWVIAFAVALGSASIYLPWSYRNLQAFDSFGYSSVEGFNLLHFNAYGMKPYLDKAAQQEIDAAIRELPVYIHTYHAQDQMLIARAQGAEALRLIFKYPLGFLISHMDGVVHGLFLFDVTILERLGGQAPGLAIAAVQIVMTWVAFLGIIDRWRTSDTPQRYILLLMVGAGLISVLSGGVLGKPKFRIPLEPLIALGIVFAITAKSRLQIGLRLF